MKAYILTETDFQKLCLILDTNPEYGYDGGSSQILTPEERAAFKAAHSFYRYKLHGWINEVKK